MTLDPVPRFSWITEAAAVLMNRSKDALSEKRGELMLLRVKAGKGETVVVGAARFARVSTEPSGKLFGRSNGWLGPDKLGAGLLGFDGMTEHKQTVLPVMEVRDRSAAIPSLASTGGFCVSNAT